MRLALECPSSLLEEVQPHADFDFILTHLVLQDKRYADFYKNSRRTKILDNSVNELSTPTSLDDIERASEIVTPNYIVSPDYLQNLTETKRSLEATLKKFSPAQILPVVQGSNYCECVDYAEYLKSLGFTFLAVPYDSCIGKSSLAVMSGCRDIIVGILTSQEFRVHLLGMTDLEELRRYRSNPKVISIDTGCPILHGMRGLRLGRDKLPDKKSPTMNQMPDYLPSMMPDIQYNIEYLRKLIG